jgi:hypothetical protein
VSLTDALSPVSRFDTDSSVEHRSIPTSGRLIINADDWGHSTETTNRIIECVDRGTISSVSAMVFMEDSERAAGLAKQSGIDAGLHLNFTTPLSAANCPTRLLERQREIADHLLRHPLARVVYHPGLAHSFEYVVAAQLNEFCRLYGRPPARIDGHHHQHLCGNVLFAGLMPHGTIVRRNFFFQTGEKSFFNRFYRRFIDRLLARRHPLVDFLFLLPPIEPDRLRYICSLASRYVVELETHPVKPNEYRFLAGGEISRYLGEVRISAGFDVPRAVLLTDTTIH